MRQKGFRELALKLSEGLLMTVTDLLLFQFYLLGASWGKGKTSRGAHQTLDEAMAGLAAVNYQTLKRAIMHLKRQGLIRSLKEPAITRAGKTRLARIIPQYQKKRPWDRVLYLVTYDIPEVKRKYRNELRTMLKTLGAGYLQGSVWITPYNPQTLLQDYVKKPGFAGDIIISCIGRDGYIGNEDIKTLVSRVYRLDEINAKYLDFINRYQHNSNAAVQYLYILKEDPQLPFELLPNEWAGDKAHEIFDKIFPMRENTDDTD